MEKLEKTGTDLLRNLEGSCSPTMRGGGEEKENFLMAAQPGTGDRNVT